MSMNSIDPALPNDEVAATATRPATPPATATASTAITAEALTTCPKPPQGPRKPNPCIRFRHGAEVLATWPLRKDDKHKLTSVKNSSLTTGPQPPEGLRKPNPCSQFRHGARQMPDRRNSKENDCPALLQDSDSPVISGRKILDCIGQGSYGKVYEAVRIETTTKEVVKVVPMSEKAKKEAEVLAELPLHENVIQQFHCEHSRKWIYIFVQHGGDKNLRQVQKKEVDQRFTIEQALRIFQPILEGVIHLHKHRVCHLDIKPDNVMWDKDGMLRLVDFGMAGYINDLVTSPCGTLPFTAPELLDVERTQAGCRGDLADCFSMGVLLFALAFGLNTMEGDLGLGWKNMSNKELHANLSTRAAEMRSVLARRDAICEHWVYYFGSYPEDRKLLLCALSAMLCPVAGQRVPLEHIMKKASP